MKILLLNQAFYPDVASTAQHATDLARALAARGHDVTALCSRRAYDSHESYAGSDSWNGVQIRRIACTALGKSARWRRAVNFGSFAMNSTLRLMTMPAFDLVIAMTSPPLISWLATKFVQRKGGRLLFWSMDLNPDEALAAGWLKKDSQTTKRLQAMLHTSLEQAETIVALDRFMADRIAAKGIDRGKIVVLPPWSHDHAVRYDFDGRNRFRDEHGLNGKFVVMYSGNHSPCHPLTTLLDAAHALANRKDIVFAFVGGGSEHRKVREFAAHHRLGNILTLPYQPLDKLSASLSSADLHTVVMGDPYVGIVHPCKIYNIRTLGIPYLYVGPAQSHIGDMDPEFSVRHGETAEAVGIIERAAAFGGHRRLGAIAAHRQDFLVEQMVHAIETGSHQPEALAASVAQR